MSTDNVITRAGRDIEPQVDQVEPEGFQIPSELRKRYDVRTVLEHEGADRRIGLFLSGDRETPSIEISGNGGLIVAHRQDPESVAALVTIAKHNGWAGIEVDGSPEFRKAVWAAGSREGLTVRGYEPTFDELAKMDALQQGVDRREREAKPTAPVVEQSTAKEGPDALGRLADAEQKAAVTHGRAAAGELSPADERLLLMLSAYGQDRKTLEENVRDDMSPMEKEFRSERLDANRAALDGALDQVLESPALVSAFAKAGYEPDDLRAASRADERRDEIADAIQLVRVGLNRQEVEREMLASFVEADREDRQSPNAAAGHDSQSASKTRVAREESQRAAAERRHEGEELADLFMHGGAERIAAEPRLANALEAQATMERHLGEVFDGDQNQTSAAVLESRQMISDVLRRGLEVSVREPAPTRQIEPPQITSDLER